MILKMCHKERMLKQAAFALNVFGFGGMRSDKNLNGSCPQIGSWASKVSLQRTETSNYELYTADVVYIRGTRQNLIQPITLQPKALALHQIFGQRILIVMLKSTLKSTCNFK